MRILIVEDEFSLADALSELLKRENYVVDVQTNGKDGLDSALTNIYDAIILDIMLPELNGLDILKTLRKESLTTPILILTARSETYDIINGLEEGADDYLTKPFDKRELIARIKAITRRKDKLVINCLQYGDIVLNTKTREIKCTETNKEITLGTKEYALLEYLINNQNIIITKEQILNKVWGPDSYNLEYNNAEVYVSFLRKKLNFIESKVKIKSIRNSGYILEVNNDK